MMRVCLIWVVCSLGWGMPSGVQALPFEIHEQEEVAVVPGASLLVFDPAVVKWQGVLEGDVLEKQVLIRNNDWQTHRIVRIESSCGCTTAEPDSRVLAAGAFTVLHVRIDTFGKRGKVHKTLVLTDEQGKQSQAFIELKVEKNPHQAGERRSIFDGKCAACHFEPAKGQVSGEAIYAAVCVMCHGKNGQGGYAPKLAGHHDKHVLQTLIAQGTGTTHMPAFAQKNGGPLTASQINALSGWIISLDD